MLNIYTNTYKNAQETTAWILQNGPDPQSKGLLDEVISQLLTRIQVRKGGLCYPRKNCAAAGHWLVVDFSELTFPTFRKFSTKFGRFSGPTWANYTPIHSLGRFSDIFRAHHSHHFLYFLIVSTKHLGVQIARRGRVIRTGGFVQRRPVHAPGNG